MWVRCLVGIAISLLTVGLSGEHVRAQAPGASGSSLPTDETLRRPSGETVTPTALTGEAGTAFLTWQPNCPWVGRYTDRVRRLASDFQSDGVRFVLVNPTPGRIESPDRPPATYVEDPGGSFSQALGATRTPQAFLFDEAGVLVYKGAIDDSPSGPDRVKTPHLRMAIKAVVDGATVQTESQKALGCALSYEP